MYQPHELCICRPPTRQESVRIRARVAGAATHYLVQDDELAPMKLIAPTAVLLIYASQNGGVVERRRAARMARGDRTLGHCFPHRHDWPDWHLIAAVWTANQNGGPHG